ncbi:MAG: SOS response-associated peptidase [Anaerolineales bacterium]|nr:SOS response-associated peptidase [Anaerolineales bacterium]
MCGRFALTIDPSDLAEAFPEFAFPTGFGPRFNIAPTQPILALPNDGTNRADFFTWGLIPSWAKDPAIGNRMINARSETLAEKPAYRAAYKYRRCLIFADAFFEWQARPGTKTKIPHLIRLKNRKPFALAGLWEHWQSPDGSEINSATIVTTAPNALLAPIHNRMPVILNDCGYTKWIDPAPALASDLQPLLVPYPASEMEAFPISTLVNSPANDLPAVVQPA